MHPGFIPLILLGAIAIRVGLHHLDKKNILEAAESKGWRDIEIAWAPFAPGWLFESGERHYRITYADPAGRWQEVYCKTSLFTGVYWRD